MNKYLKIDTIIRIPENEKEFRKFCYDHAWHYNPNAPRDSIWCDGYRRKLGHADCIVEVGREMVLCRYSDLEIIEQ